MRVPVLTFAALVAFSPAGAQVPGGPPNAAPTENVTVTAPKQVPDAALQDFIASYTAPSPASGKIARWRAGACPITVGLRPAANAVVTQRVRQIAALVGAPVGTPDCKPNIDIVFTLNPQRLLDQVEKKTPVLLGYHEASQARDIATVGHPIQAWYTTQTVDHHGQPRIDDKTRYEPGFDVAFEAGGVFQSIHIDSHVEQVTGSHLGDGRSSELYHVIVVVDLARVVGRQVGTLADDIAMLSLAQTHGFGLCRPVASITNMDAEPCDAAVMADGMTGNDLAYLRGLYSMDASGTFTRQRSQIADAMKATLAGR